MQYRLDEYLNQQAVWERVQKKDAFAQDEYAPPRKIAVRRMNRERVVTDNLGAQVASKQTYYCREAVRTMDRMDGQVVLTVREWTDKYGCVCGREVCV